MTCYFIDTAHNVIAYIENISKILKPGGYWINLGKLAEIMPYRTSLHAKKSGVSQTAFEEHNIFFSGSYWNTCTCTLYMYVSYS